MIGEEFIEFLEIGSIAVLLVLLLQSIHWRREVWSPRGSVHKLADGPPAAKLLSNHRLSFGCRPNLVGVVPFVSLLLSSARHIRVPAVEGTPRNFQAAAGNLYLRHWCWNALDRKEQTLVLLAANRAPIALVCSGQILLPVVSRRSESARTDMLPAQASQN